DLMFAGVDPVLGDLTDEQIKANEQPLFLQLEKLERSVNTIDAILVVDKIGQVLVSSVAFPTPIDRPVADRDYFQAQVERDAGTYVGAILQPRVRKDPFFGISRRRPLREGQFS